MIIALVILLLSSCDAWAYPTPVDFNGKLSRWEKAGLEQPLTVLVDAENVYDAIYFGGLVDEAVAIWSQVETSALRMVPADPNVREDILVQIVESMDEAPFSAGYSTFDKFDSDGNAEHCSIKILSSLSFMSFAKTVLHELGHCVGLGHSLIPEAIMSYQLSSTEFALDTDDVAAVSRLYPLDGSKPQLPMGCAVGRGNDSDWAHVLYMLPLLLLILFHSLSPFGRKKGEKPFDFSPNLNKQKSTTVATATLSLE